MQQALKSSLEDPEVGQQLAELLGADRLLEEEVDAVLFAVSLELVGLHACEEGNLGELELGQALLLVNVAVSLVELLHGLDSFESIHLGHLEVKNHQREGVDAFSCIKSLHDLVVDTHAV